MVSAIFLLSRPVAAQSDSTHDSDDDTIVNIDLDGVIEAINELKDAILDFTENWDGTLQDLLIEVLFGPFKHMAKFMASQISSALLHAPPVTGNPAINEIYTQSLAVTFLVATLVFMIAGILYMIGPVLGVGYREVRMIIPRVIVALVFATVALPLLQYMVDFSNTLVIAFKPDAFDATLNEIYGLQASLILVYFINAWLLLAVALIFVLRAVYIIFVAAISPLIALCWSLPRAKRYADSLIAGWFTALAMGPLDMIVFKLALSLMEGDYFTGINDIASWLLGVGTLILLVWVPYQLYGASQSAVGQAYAVAGDVKTRVEKHQRKQRRVERQQRLQRHRQRRNSGRRAGRNMPGYRNPGGGQG
ncbi:hypothetical protein [Halorhabdus salina]|uniref:hypothetical protein n=1 Tax=Halorhabdus salina TaxID=2750670 RepID=UPI0015EF2364|nr:hypothetical protein [Halorhabdus salina]